MQTDSRMAPQQPKNAMNTTIEPSVMSIIGKTACIGKPTWPSTSITPMLLSMSAPKTMPKRPTTTTTVLNANSTYLAVDVPQSIVVTLSLYLSSKQTYKIQFG
uniref:Uncharacterized protein n=1 Tax=Bactrocera dorsalis TaxID=27457 RepID=A0A034VSB8_BACDO